MRIVVSGVTSGIGRALVGQLVERGHEVWGLGRKKRALNTLEQEHGGRFRGITVDLSVPKQREAVFAEHFGAGSSSGEAGASGALEIDALVNNAALCTWSKSLALSDAVWSDLLQTNLLAVIALTRAVVPRLVPGGQIISVSSVAARHVAHPAFGPYALTKAALDHFSESLRLELAPKGVRVGTISPGLVDTEIYSKIDGFETMEKRLRDGIPRWLSSGEVAQSLCWMLEQPRHIQVTNLTMLPTGQPR